MKHLFILLFLFTAWTSFGQTVSEPENSVDELRTQSGIDPTRITSRIGYSYIFTDKEANMAQINNRLVATLGVNHWSFQVKTDIVTTNQAPGTGWAAGLGDLRFSILNAFYVKGRSALAGSVEFGIPTASRAIAPYVGMGSYFYATPSLTYSLTITPSLMFAVQPQYTFAITKAADNYPDMNILTLRIFLAYFAKSGYFFVIEPRPIYDFTNKSFDLVISPIIGKSLGGGFNLVFLADIPTTKSGMLSKGATYQLGVTKSF